MSSLFSYLSWFKVVLLMVAFMSGILSIIREAILIHKPDTVHEKKLFWGCIRIAFFVSAIVLWGTEHHEVLTLNAELNEATVPRLKMEVDQIGIGTAGSEIPQLNGRTTVFIVANVVNTGAPSIAEGYHLTVTLPDGTKYSDIAPFKTTEQKDMRLFLGHSSTGESVVFSQADTLFEKTFAKPIEKGTRVRGVLGFALPVGVEPKSVKAKGTTFSLSCRDISDNTVEARAEWRGDAEQPRYYPGLTYPPNQSLPTVKN
jgi:hypothetical protein